MTTAARPTFDTARGGQGLRERDLSALSKQYSARDLPSHMSLKTRHRPDDADDDEDGRPSDRKALKRDLEVREKKAQRKRKFERQSRNVDRQDDSFTAITDESSSSSRVKSNQSSRSSATDGDVGSEGSSSNSSSSRNDGSESQTKRYLDADDPLDSDESRSSDSDDDDDDEESMNALMAELSKIKKERSEEQAAKEAEAREEAEQIRMENLLSGNPLLRDRYSDRAKKSDLSVKRRWDDDVVFKNCAKSVPEKTEPEFINDSLRCDFHRKFMKRYIR